MSRIVIAGCGYVGRSLAVELLGRGHEVWGLNRGGAPGLPGLRGLQVDLYHAGSLGRVPAAADVAYYLASPDGRDRDAYRRCYLTGLRNLAGACRADRFVLATSTAVYGQKRGEWVDEDSETEPADYRGQTLLEGERWLASSHPGATCVRFAGIYGPGRDRLVRQVRGGTAQCHEPPRYTNRIHRDDCSGLLLHIAELASPQELYLGVDDEPAGDCEVLDWLARRLGVAAPERVSADHDANKRARNARIRASGYDFRYPSYREGYAALIP